jgi:membrane protein DedA with SNARE-associated domain
MIDRLLNFLTEISEFLPVPAFTFIGSFVEEILAPIPSPFVMTLAGSLAKTQNEPIFFLLFLAIIGSIGKTIGSVIIYVIADKFEDVITSKFGKFIGLSHKQITSIHGKLEQGIGEWFILFILRALPVMPTAPVSAAAGILEMDKKTYITSTAAGLVVRNLFYLYLGYTSTDALSNLNNNLDSIESIGYGLILVFLIGVVFLIYRARRKHL